MQENIKKSTNYVVDTYPLYSLLNYTMYNRRLMERPMTQTLGECATLCVVPPYNNCAR